MMAKSRFPYTLGAAITVALFASGRGSAAPVQSQPATQQPVSQQPVSQQPTSPQPASEQPTSQQPGAQQPASQQPPLQPPPSPQPASPQTQTTSPQPSSPAGVADTQSFLNEAKQALERVPNPGGQLADAFGDLRRDFDRLQMMYASQHSATSSAQPRPTDSAAAGAGGAPTAVGTSGVSSSPIAGTAGSNGLPAVSWQMMYQLIQADIAALNAGTAASPDFQRALQDFRSRLDSFYTVASPVGESAFFIPAATPNREAIALLERMQQVLQRQEDLGGQGLKVAGKVTVDRADLDEIGAEIQMLKAMLHR